jgi:hypothetical protein
MHSKAYLDIETSYAGDITVIGVFRPPDRLIQVVHPEVSLDRLLEALEGSPELLTYWGHRFDLPVIRRALGVNLRQIMQSTDLADHCHRRGLYGGLKAVERELGIYRRTAGMCGGDALVLWERWTHGDRNALRELLRYNEDDVVNLYLLEKELLRMETG